MPNTFSPTELADIVRIVGSVPPGTSPANAIRYAARKHGITESALTTALASVKAGTVPAAAKTVTETATPSGVDPAEMQRAVNFAAEVNAAESKPLASATTADLHLLLAAYS